MIKKVNSLYTLFLLGLGTLLEWAEYTVYGYSAIIISQQFFPTAGTSLGLIKAFSVFAVGYIMRPLGAVLFGYIGDTYGRKPALMGALILMGVATLGIGLLPNYESIGIAAPLMLCIFRLMQGIAVSGEFNGAAIYMIESGTTENVNLRGAWISANAALGMVIGGVSAMLASQPGMPDWAWRVPFIVGGISAILGLILRRKLNESGLFQHHRNQKDQVTYSFASLLAKYSKSILFVGLTGAFAGIFVYINNIYLVTHLQQSLNISFNCAMKYAIFGEGLSCILILICARLADLTNSRIIFYSGLFLTIPLSPYIFSLSSSKNPQDIIHAMIIFACINGLTSGPMMKCVYDQFPVLRKYLGISLSWSLFAALFGGTAPLVAHYMSQQGLNPGWYVCAFALICLAFLPVLDAKARPTHTTRATGPAHIS